jgi:cytoskeletal protein RodZ
MATPASDSSKTNLHDTSTTTKADESIALGKLLRQSREHRGMSLEQIAGETKIPLRHLQALERDDLSVVPEGLYRRAKIRAYARAVHFDQEALAKLEHAMQAAEPPLVVPEEVSLPATPFRKSVLVTLAAIGTALVLGLVTRGKEDKAPAVVQSNGTVDPQQPLQPTAPVPVVDEEQRTTPENEQTLDSPVATVGGPISPPEPLPTVADTEPVVAQPATTELLITSEPAGARVTVDGIGWGSTPVTIRHVSPGTRHIRVTKDGYQSEDRASQVVGNRLNALHIAMQAVP